MCFWPWMFHIIFLPVIPPLIYTSLTDFFHFILFLHLLSFLWIWTQLSLLQTLFHSQSVHSESCAWLKNAINPRIKKLFSPVQWSAVTKTVCKIWMRTGIMQTLVQTYKSVISTLETLSRSIWPSCSVILILLWSNLWNKLLTSSSGTFPPSRSCRCDWMLLWKQLSRCFKSSLHPDSESPLHIWNPDVTNQKLQLSQFKLNKQRRFGLLW